MSGAIFFPLFLTIIFFFFRLRFRMNVEQFRKFLQSAHKNDIIIIFNPGGWGYTPLEKSDDFSPVVEGIKKTLCDLGHNPIIIPYLRAKNSFLGKITVIKEALNSFNEHNVFSEEVEDFLNKNPDKKVIMVGLSFGAYFVDKVMEKFSESFKNRIFAIELGSPFWKNPSPENILRFNNDGADPISKGEIKGVTKGFFRIYFKWILEVIFGRKISLSEMLHFKGHDYSWLRLEPEITPFLEKQ